ncbi:MAG: CBS domain-containing protein [Planctomycetes bacterium]|nr:CBS domain-containing protein [Planctomycetota bacterium]
MFETKSIMTTNVIAVKRDTPIGRAIEILVDKDVTGLPVINDDMTLAGMITEKDVLRLISDLEDDSAKVEDFMSKDVVSFDQDEDIIAICECLVNANFRRVPILSEGKLVGIVSRRDIVKYILEPL